MKTNKKKVTTPVSSIPIGFSWKGRPYFKVHAHGLTEEITNNDGMGILKYPLNLFRGLLVEVGERAAQINDPVMNALMCDLAIYAIADPWNPEYDPKAVEKVYTSAKQQLEKEKKEAT